MHFPRWKFEALREVLDEASRSKVTTPITLYRAIFETRRLLRSASRTMNFICEQAGLRRPPLQICEACGNYSSWVGKTNRRALIGAARDVGSRGRETRKGFMSTFKRAWLRRVRRRLRER
jgi:hypothetical protein